MDIQGQWPQQVSNHVFCCVFIECVYLHRDRWVEYPWILTAEQGQLQTVGHLLVKHDGDGE